MDLHADQPVGAAPASSLSHWLSAAWRRKWSVLGIALVLLAAGLGLARLMFGPQVIAVLVERGNLVQTVVASGHIETPYRVEIGSQITGTVADVLVREGQEVREGQKLVAIEASELQAAMVQAEGAVAQAEARVRQLRELTKPAADQALQQAHANLLNAEAAYERASKLAASGYGTKATLDDATKNLDVARTQVRTAELQVYTSSPVGSDYVMAETLLGQARANLNTARARLGYASIVAPRDGVLITRKVERGSVVQPGKALLVLAPAGDSQIVVQIDEKNLGQLALGQSALASADAYPDKRFAARLSYINPSVDINRASVEIKLAVTDPPNYLRQDMTVSVDIATARRENAVIVPARAVNDATTVPYVLKAENGRAIRQPVRLGLRGVGAYEVIEGLVPGDRVIPLTTGVKPDQRIRVVVP
ncbi:efflux RND transporter periplasmic adaptor subunit [Rhodopseudomonas pseudopalustris]|uniref:Secretion protein HlyD n=2 Tax=Rhodopseudomonas TaxID=1073 RepID=Q13B33_RHOPS|nr:efflux RND transporter periplasmic adaptor subunit [Rhodopseudomonas pseudopalustris]ABE38706.1 secretion protein HlyD [Rhodopseudomonas palustris BisB5]MBB1091935.1 efflux RND transporter periplasmic adaptor subunit [Rhodopseudomonas palustris]SEO39166.1 HlyD family secretion protein [Rhodopseudomonas pseudopalustris]